jgi:hypothetical protein
MKLVRKTTEQKVEALLLDVMQLRLATRALAKKVAPELVEQFDVIKSSQPPFVRQHPPE